MTLSSFLLISIILARARNIVTNRYNIMRYPYNCLDIPRLCCMSDLDALKQINKQTKLLLQNLQLYAKQMSTISEGASVCASVQQNWASSVQIFTTAFSTETCSPAKLEKVEIKPQLKQREYWL